MIRRCTVLITLGRSGQRDDLAWPPPLPRRASTDVQEVGSQPDERRRRIHDLPWASPGTDRAPAQSMLVPIAASGVTSATSGVTPGNQWRDSGENEVPQGTLDGTSPIIAPCPCAFEIAVLGKPGLADRARLWRLAREPSNR